MKTCPQCGKSYTDEHRFCSECGSPLSEAVAPEAPEVQETPETEAGKLPETEAGKLPETEDAGLTETEEASPAQPPEEDVSAPAGETPEEKNKGKEKPKKEKPPVGLGRRLLAGLLCLLLFVFLSASALDFFVERAAAEKGLRAVLSEIDVGKLRVDPFFDDVDEEMTLSRMLAEDLDRIGLTMSEKTVNRLLRSSTLKSFFAAQLSELFSDIRRGRSQYEFDPQELAEELLESRNLRLLEKEGISLNREQAGQVAAMLNSYGLGALLSRDELRDEQPALERALHVALSPVTLGALLLAVLALIVLIFRANRGRMGLSLGDIGGTALAVGALLSLAALAARLLPGLWERVCAGQQAAAAVSGAVLWTNLRVSLIALGAGLLLAVLGRLLRGKKAKKA